MKAIKSKLIYFFFIESHQVPLLISQWQMQIYSLSGRRPLLLTKKNDSEYIRHTNSGNPQHFGLKYAIVFT